MRRELFKARVLCKMRQIRQWNAFIIEDIVGVCGRMKNKRGVGCWGNKMRRHPLGQLCGWLLGETKTGRLYVLINVLQFENFSFLGWHVIGITRVPPLALSQKFTQIHKTLDARMAGWQGGWMDGGFIGWLHVRQCVCVCVFETCLPVWQSTNVAHTVRISII